MTDPIIIERTEIQEIVDKAITRTLTALEYLVKTSIMRKGEYGEQNHCWTLKKGL